MNLVAYPTGNDSLTILEARSMKQESAGPAPSQGSSRGPFLPLPAAGGSRRSLVWGYRVAHVILGLPHPSLICCSTGTCSCGYRNKRPPRKPSNWRRSRRQESCLNPGA
uniref:Cilia and flagella associated protein 77 n=1 Tax=Pan paniscus TaxID=9597 RepID=A0A2R8ZZ22_PANPA